MSNDYKNNPLMLYDHLGRGESSELRAAVKYLYKKVFANVSHYIKQNGGGEADVRDIISQGLSITYVKRQQNILKKDNIPGFLYVVCRNKWLDHLRYRKNIHIEIDDEENKVGKNLIAPENNEQKLIEQEKLNKIVREEIDKLKDPDRSIFMDKYFGEMSLKQLSEKYKITVDYLKQLLFRTRKKLRNNLNGRTDFTL